MGSESSIESKAWTKARRILASRVFSATWGPSRAQPKTTVSAATRSAAHAFEAPRLPRRALRGRDPDREPARHHLAGAGDSGARRPCRLRGHARDPQAVRPLRAVGAAHRLSRPQRRSGAAENPGAACRRGGRRPGLGCRHAADLRSGLPAGARSRCGGACGECGARPLLGADGADRGGTADRPVLLRGLPAREGNGTAHADRRAGAHPRHARAVRKRAAPCRDAVRSRGRAWAARSRGRARTHQAARGSPARRSRLARRRLRGRARKRAARWSS